MPRDPQFGVRRRTASPRRLVLRLVMLDLSNGFFQKLTDSFDDPPAEEQPLRVTHAFELPLTDEKQGTTEGQGLDADSLRSLRSMFLLLDDWDRQLHRKKETQHSSEECEIWIDSETH